MMLIMIGYGDVYLVIDLGKIFIMIYVIVGLGIMVMFILVVVKFYLYFK